MEKAFPSSSSRPLATEVASLALAAMQKGTARAATLLSPLSTDCLARFRLRSIGGSQPFDEAASSRSGSP
jgi:hypothetical protein